MFAFFCSKRLKSIKFVVFLSSLDRGKIHCRRFIIQVRCEKITFFFQFFKTLDYGVIEEGILAICGWRNLIQKFFQFSGIPWHRIANNTKELREIPCTYFSKWHARNILPLVWAESWFSALYQASLELAFLLLQSYYKYVESQKIFFFFISIRLTNFLTLSVWQCLSITLYRTLLQALCFIG